MILTLTEPKLRLWTGFERANNCFKTEFAGNVFEDHPGKRAHAV